MLHLHFDKEGEVCTFQLNLDFCNLPRFIREHATMIYETVESTRSTLRIHKDRYGLMNMTVVPAHLNDVRDWLAARGIFDPTMSSRERLGQLTRISRTTREFVKVPAEILIWAGTLVNGSGDEKG